MYAHRIMAMGGAVMHNAFFMRIIALGAFAALCLGTARVDAATLNTADFIAACGADASIAEDPGLEDGKVTPKVFCECIAGELDKNKLSQKDVDMLTKMHKEEISDADVESYPTIEDLLNANEGYEDIAGRARHRLEGTDGEGRRDAAGRGSPGRG
jgi:hypothetical protein